jgi:hypothetical protein
MTPGVYIFWHFLDRRLGGPHNHITRHNLSQLALRFDSACSHKGAHRGAIGWGTALQTGRSRVRWCHWNFSLRSFRPQYGPEVDSASNRNEYQEYFLGCKGGWCVGLTTLPPSCTACHEIWESQPPGTLRACPAPYTKCITYSLKMLQLPNRLHRITLFSHNLKQHLTLLFQFSHCLDTP